MPLSRSKPWARKYSTAFFKRHAVEVAQLGESGNEGGCVLRVQQRCGGSGAFVDFLVLHIFAYLVDYFLEAHRLHDIAHDIAFAYERCRLVVEVRTVRLHHNRLHLALGMCLSPGPIVGALSSAATVPEFLIRREPASVSPDALTETPADAARSDAPLSLCSVPHLCLLRHLPARLSACAAHPLSPPAFVG